MGQIEDEQRRAEELGRTAQFQETPAIVKVREKMPLKGWADLHFLGLTDDEVRVVGLHRMERERREALTKARIRVYGRIVAVVVAVMALAAGLCAASDYFGVVSLGLFSHQKTAPVTPGTKAH